jgi:hypothetical protein
MRSLPRTRLVWTLRRKESSEGAMDQLESEAQAYWLDDVLVV